MTKVIEESASVIRERQELLKQVIYAIESLPVTSMFVGGVSAAVSLMIFFALSIVTGAAKASWVLLPLPVALLGALLLGLAWLFSIVGVVVRDLRDVLSTLLGLSVYLSPVVLSRSIAGDDIWRLILYNPLSHVVICFRNIFYGQFDPFSWLLFGAMASGALLAGSIVMSRAKSMINEHL
jgi:ABC-type polysaccharide/polyol phosphate export permease